MRKLIATRWSILVGAVLLMIPQAVFAAGNDPAQRPPNIVLMFADDLGYADLKCFGHPYANTPNLDGLARDGTRFTQFYVTGVTCNPSRTGLMTGRFPARFARYTADFGFGKQTTITELFRRHGYRTGHFGKWHIGPDQANGTYGIDTVEVIGKSRDREAGRDDELYSAAIRFIRQHRDEPFYVNIWGHATHYPVDVSPNRVRAFSGLRVSRKDFSRTMQLKFDQCEKIGGDINRSMQQYLADVSQIDDNVGRVLQTLEELGLQRNTLVVFSSDHGPAPVILEKLGPREFSPNMLGYAGEFRGGKHQQYEGGIRVPFIVRWPGHVPAGRLDQKSVGSFVDWLPTLCSIAGITDLPKGLDGEDLSDIWKGAERKRNRPLFWKTSSPTSTPVIRDGNWKLHLPVRRQGKPELYDLSLDPAESRNLAKDRPEVVQRLSRKIKDWVQELPATYEKKKQRKKSR